MATLLQYKATPVIENLSQSGARQAIEQAIVVDQSPVQSIGAVDFKSPFLPQRGGVPEAITLVLANPSDEPAIFLFGDPDGLIEAILGGTYADPEVPSSSYESVRRGIARNPSILKSINYRITLGSPSQFSNKFQYAFADLDGSLTIKPINIQSAQRNTQMNDKILTMASQIYMSDTTAILLTVGPETEVQLDLSWEKILRTGNQF